MDLFETLRVSLYLLVGTGALSIGVAEGSFFLVAIVALAGLGAYVTMDRFRFKPLSANLTAVFTVALLFLTLRPLREDENWQAHFPAAVAHFLILWQVLLFFSGYSGPVLLTFCGSTLAVVVMSGVLQPGTSLILRVAAFVAMAAWTLYIHALWRSRQEFASESTAVALDAAPGKARRRARSEQVFPERAVWGTVALVLALTAGCMVLGTALFFSAPRLDGVLSFFERRQEPGRGFDGGPLQAGSEGGTAKVSGMSERVTLRDLGPIGMDSRVAFTVDFDRPLSAIVNAKRRVLLKGLNFSAYADGEWIADAELRGVESRNGAAIEFLDPSVPEAPKRSGDDITQTIETAALETDVLFAAGPVRRVRAPEKIKIDSEGSLRSGTAQALQRYTLVIGRAPSPEDVNIRAVAEHRDLQRYVLKRGLNVGAAEDVGRLARRIAHDIPSHREKANAIARWLEANCDYSRELSAGPPGGEPLLRFLLSRERVARRGPCGLFASAFVILCRFNDLPARLCSGFGVGVGEAELAGKTLAARNADAHAWAEVYFKDSGWVAFDPTPPQRERDSKALEARANVARTESQPEAAKSETAPPAEAVTKAGVEGWWETVINFSGREQRKWYSRLSGGSGTQAGGWLAGKNFGWVGIGLVWIAMTAAIGWLVQLFVRRHVRKRASGAAGGVRSRAAVAFYNDLLQALSRRGYTRRPGQTPREFAEAVLRRGGSGYAPVLEVTTIFETVRYGGADLEQDEFNRLQEALDRIREMTF